MISAIGLIAVLSRRMAGIICPASPLETEGKGGARYALPPLSDSLPPVRSRMRADLPERLRR
jgi:hypothetical protein